MYSLQFYKPINGMKEKKEIVNFYIKGALQTPLKNPEDFEWEVAVFKTEN